MQFHNIGIKLLLASVLKKGRIDGLNAYRYV